jgi:hypothetical protein
MAASDQYQLDIGSVRTLIQDWQRGSGELAGISRQLTGIHDQLEHAIPSALIAGLLGEVPLAECFAKLAGAMAAANGLAQGLTQDTSTLNANLAAYEAAEASARAKLRAVQPAKHPGHHRHHGSTHRGSGGSSTAGASGGGGGRGVDFSGNTVQPPGPATYANQAQVRNWINQAFQALKAAGVAAGELDEAGVQLIIEHESSGNPNALNNWDSNAKAGDPSRGLMQVIGTTFNAYKLPGHGDIYNPVDNIIAGVRYAISRYGSIQNVPGVRSVAQGGKYVGY